MALNTPEFTHLTNLLDGRFGSKVLFATDEWFACAANLTNAEEPVFIDGKFTDHGKWMDGWETRRKRTPGHDWCILRLGLPGVIHGIDVDTAFFTGNHAPRVSIQAICLDSDPKELEELENKPGNIGTCATEKDMFAVEKIGSKKWHEILKRTEIKPGYSESRHNYFAIHSEKRYTHLRLNMYPDGGIARLRVYGKVAIDWDTVKDDAVVDLAAVENGGIALGCSDAHFGHPRNLIGPGRAINMGDGWETARKQNRPAVLQLNNDGLLDLPGNDWALLKLGTSGIIHKIEVDTNHFKGNYPESCLIEGCWFNGSDDEFLDGKAIKWETVVPRSKLDPDKRHFFDIETEQIKFQGPISHIRLMIYPDGGISRLRVYGIKSKKAFCTI